MTGNLTIRDALVIPMTKERQSFHGFVRVRDGMIAEVRPGAAAAAPGEEILDARGAVLMPGLINAHTHLYQVLLRAVWEDLPLLAWLRRIYGAAQALRPEHFYGGTLLGCVESIRSGVTTVCEHNFLNPHPDCAFETVRAIRDSGLRAVFARTIMDTGEIVPECVKEKPADAFRHIEALIKAYAGSELLAFMTGPNTPPINSTVELLKEIRQFADATSIGISAHVAESRAVVDAVRAQHDRSGVIDFLHGFGITAPNSIFAHSVHVSADEVGLLQETGTSVSHNPVSNMMLGDGVAPVVEMLRRGVNVALGTDGAASNHSQDLFDTMKSASLLQKVHHQNAAVIDPYTVLRMATIGGARALGLSSKCGSIETGKRADLILIDIDRVHNQPVNEIFSQIVHCAKASDVQTVFVNGEMLMRNGRLTHLEEGLVVAGAKSCNRDLMARLRSTRV